MGKKILCATFMVALMAVAGYNVYLSQTEEKLSELALANVEALAQNDVISETKSTIQGECFSSVVFTCECKVICNDCKSIWYPSPRVSKAAARNVKGHCSCGNADWSDYDS